MMHRIWSMLTDFSGNEGGENLMCCFGLLLVLGMVGIASLLVMWLA